MRTAAAVLLVVLLGCSSGDGGSFEHASEIAGCDGFRDVQRSITDHTSTLPQALTAIRSAASDARPGTDRAPYLTMVRLLTDIDAGRTDLDGDVGAIVDACKAYHS